MALSEWDLGEMPITTPFISLQHKRGLQLWEFGSINLGAI